MKYWEHEIVTTSAYLCITSYFKNIISNYFIYSGLILVIFCSNIIDFDVFIYKHEHHRYIPGYIAIKGHRGFYHYYVNWLFFDVVGLIILVILYNMFSINVLYIYLFYVFSFAVYMHILEDSVTSSGVPYKKYDDDYYKSFSFSIGKYDSFTIMFLALAISSIMFYIAYKNFGSDLNRFYSLYRFLWYIGFHIIWGFFR
jgi:membrane-bound metal-dependent hydrolase YbcI (DUF457 family)